MIVKYAVVYERIPNNYCVYAPELPGCIGTGRTWGDIRGMIQEAITFHPEDMAESGDTIHLLRMSVGDAMVYRIDSLAQASEAVPDLETTFGIVEVELATSDSPATSA